MLVHYQAQSAGGKSAELGASFRIPLRPSLPEKPDGNGTHKMPESLGDRSKNPACLMGTGVPALWSLGDRSENARDHRRLVMDVAADGLRCLGIS